MTLDLRIAPMRYFAALKGGHLHSAALSGKIAFVIIFHIFMYVVSEEDKSKTFRISQKSLFLGRNRLCEVGDIRCSRQQVELQQITDSSVQVTQLGPHGSYVNGSLIGRWLTQTVTAGKTLHLLKGLYAYRFVDEIEGPNSAKEMPTKRKSSYSPSKTSPKAKKPSQASLSSWIPKERNDVMEMNDSEDKTDSSARHDEKQAGHSKNISSKTSWKFKSIGKKSDSAGKSNSDQLDNVGDTSTMEPQTTSDDDNDDGKISEVQKRLADLQETAKQLSTSSKTDQRPAAADDQCASAPCNEVGWDDSEHLHVYSPERLEHRSKIASFDLDRTLICTKSGKTFPTDSFDWQILYAEIPKKLKALYQKGYKVCIFSNQRGLIRGHTDLPSFKKKIESIVKMFGVPIQAYVSNGGGTFRKPLPGMWNQLVNHHNGGLPVVMADSFYVGDAAGREPGAYLKKKDFACSDRLFALNVGIPFHTPEEFFLNKPVLPHVMPKFDPKAFMSIAPPLVDPQDTELIRDHTEIILMVGYPGSGKSTFVRDNLVSNHPDKKERVVVNQDTLKTLPKCLGAVEQAVKLGKSAVVDNTNPEKSTRAKYLELAKKLNVPVRCFVMQVGHAHAAHNNKFRHAVGTDKEHKSVNEMVLNTFKSKYQEPAADEGYEEVVKVNFVPRFKDDERKDYYSMYMVEK